MTDIHSVLITGAWTGIGLEFTRQFLKNPEAQAQIVIATCLVPDEAAVSKKMLRISYFYYLEYFTLFKIFYFISIVERKQITLVIKYHFTFLFRLSEKIVHVPV